MGDNEPVCVTRIGMAPVVETRDSFHSVCGFYWLPCLEKISKVVGDFFVPERELRSRCHVYILWVCAVLGGKPWSADRAGVGMVSVLRGGLERTQGSCIAEPLAPRLSDAGRPRVPSDAGPALPERGPLWACPETAQQCSQF